MAEGPITRTNTLIGKIGNSLAILAEEKDTIENEKFGTVPSLDLSFGNEAGSKAEKAVKNICEALALSELKRVDSDWELGPTIGPGECDRIKSKFDVKLVFEEPGQAILLVPSKNNLDYGLQEPPMKEFDYILRIDEVIKGKIALLQELSKKIQNLEEISGEPLEEKVKRTTDEFIEENDNLKPLDPVDVFHDQLGAYSCRQCG